MTAAVEMEARENQQLIDELWDFADAAASEARFRAAAADLAAGQRRDVLMTQVARALGLRGQFDDALAMLNGLTSAAAPDVATPEVELAVRGLLERRRVSNSSGSPADARPLFEAAFERASTAGLEHLGIDALHMVAIIAPADEQAALNKRALTLASGASDPRARDWRASLLNNLGWTRFEAGEYGRRWRSRRLSRNGLGRARRVRSEWRGGRSGERCGRLAATTRHSPLSVSSVAGCLRQA